MSSADGDNLRVVWNMWLLLVRSLGALEKERKKKSSRGKLSVCAFCHGDSAFRGRLT